MLILFRYEIRSTLLNDTIWNMVVDLCFVFMCFHPGLFSVETILVARRVELYASDKTLNCARWPMTMHGTSQLRILTMPTCLDFMRRVPVSFRGLWMLPTYRPRRSINIFISVVQEDSSTMCTEVCTTFSIY